MNMEPVLFVADAWRYHNQLTPISRLPLEILSEVFCHLQEDSPFHPSHLRPKPSWIILLQVCRYWRHVAQECKELWTIIPLWNKDWTCISLRLSKPLPISLYINEEDMRWPTDVEAVPFALAELSRVKELKWVDVREGWDEDNALILMNAEDLLSTLPVPLLERLELVYREAPDDDIESNLFAGAIPPLLQTLTIINRDISHNSTLLQSPLTTLILESCMVWDNVDEMIDTLSRLPSLEVFHSKQPGSFLSLLDISDSRVHAPRCVNLPRMQELCIRDQTPQVVAVLRYLCMPQNVTLNVTGTAPLNGQGDDENPGTITNLVQFLTNHYASASYEGRFFHPLYIDIYDRPEQAFVISGLDLLTPVEILPGTDFSLREAGECCPRGSFYFSFELDRRTLSFDPLARLLREVPVLLSSRWLNVADPSYMPGPISLLVLTRTDWDVVFRDSQGVEKVGVGGHAALSFLRAWGTPTGLDAEPEEIPSAALLFPNLVDLSLYDLSFQENAEDNEGRTLYECLVAGIRRRTNSNHRAPGHLSIRNCDIDESMVEGLRALLTEDAVKWDGKTECSLWRIYRQEQKLLQEMLDLEAAD